MGENTKELRSRMKSVDSTLHLTNAMGLVASSKLRRASDANNACAAYTEACRRAAAGLAASGDCQRSLWVAGNGSEQKKLIVIAGDRGLAGGYNANVFRLAAQTAAGQVIPIGRRACDRYGAEPVSSESYTSAQAHALAKSLCTAFREGRCDRVAIAATRYVSMMTQEAYVRQLLPLAVPKDKKSGSALFEPDEMTILEAAIPEYVAGAIMAAVRESFASEVAARRMAMDSAGKNASAMKDDLQLQYNRARQGAITQEITEIVAGSGA